MMTGQVNHQE